MHGKLILLLALCAAAASAQPVPWGVQHTQQTGINTTGIDRWALAPDGSIYLAVDPPQPSVRKATAAGQTVFSTPLRGVSTFAAIRIGPDNNIYLLGNATAAFVSTPGAYQSMSSQDTGFLCKLRGSDGEIVYCSHVNMTPSGSGTLSVDPQGNAYVASNLCFGSTVPGCVEKFSASGTALIYEFPLASFGADSESSIAADDSGGLYVAGSGPRGFILAKLDPDGHMRAVANDPNILGYGLQLDPAGNPQVLTTAGSVRRYRADLSGIVFDQPIGINLNGAMMAPDGSTVLFGATTSSNLSLLHPTASCDLPADAQYYGVLFPLLPEGVMVRLDDGGNLIQMTFMPILSGTIPVGFAQAGGVLLLAETDNDLLEAVTVGPMPEIQLACAANAASPLVAPLAPLEIVSLYGSNLGPAQPVSGKPGPDGRYPTVLSGTQLTFDGVPAPLLYAGAAQINTVTPSALSGKETTQICAIVNGVSTNCMDAPVQPANPAVFLADVSQGNLAAALNQDGTINSQANPAPVGSVVSIFATGLGALIHAIPDGSVTGLPVSPLAAGVEVFTALPQAKPTNTIRFSQVPVLYAGPAPFEIEGLTQINIQVPASPDLYVFVNAKTLITTLTGVSVWVTP